MTDASPESGPESVEAAVQRLEDRLAATRGQASRAMRELHRRMIKDVRAAERRAKRAEKRLAEAKDAARRARRRARRAERELAAVRSARPAGAWGLVGRTARRIGLRRP
jgi:chromosome segregation ATPase